MASIIENLNEVINTKNNIKGILIDNGIDPGDVFSDYPDLIRSIVGGGGDISQDKIQEIINTYISSYGYKSPDEVTEYVNTYISSYGYLIPSGSINVVENGNDVDVSSYATANINVPIPEGYIIPSGNIDITNNGTEIDVSSYATASVGVEIPDGYIIPSGSIDISENGTFDVTTYANAIVNVASSGTEEPEDEYDMEYFNIKNTGTNNMTINIVNIAISTDGEASSTGNDNFAWSCSYSFDKSTWTNFTTKNSNPIVLCTLEPGNTVYVKSNEPRVRISNSASISGNNYFNSFKYNCKAFGLSGGNGTVSGNALSLEFGDDFRHKKVSDQGHYACLFYNSNGLYNANHLKLHAEIKENSYDFYKCMFYGCTKLINNPELGFKDIAPINCCYRMFYNCNSLTTAPTLPATKLRDSCYYRMFFGCSILNTAPVLPAETLEVHCYDGMFYNCKALTTAPVLPATTLANYCYYYMFYGCTSLTNVPTLPATTLANYCYSNMFNGCSSLTSVPTNYLPVTTLASNCYQNMFGSCTSLTNVPTLPATTLANYCYSSMFNGCKALTSVPTNYLPATTLANYCYRSMFQACNNLTNAPDLPATTLATGCYENMFYTCISITTSPVLPALELTNKCYNSMFYRCSKLNYIKALFTTAPSNTYTNNWVNGVSSTGTFVKNSAATWTATGNYAVPNGWTIETAAA